MNACGVYMSLFYIYLLCFSGDAAYNSPLSPVELLIALHNIDPTKCDMKTIIKGTVLNLFLFGI